MVILWNKFHENTSSAACIFMEFISQDLFIGKLNSKWSFCEINSMNIINGLMDFLESIDPLVKYFHEINGIF